MARRRIAIAAASLALWGQAVPARAGAIDALDRFLAQTRAATGRFEQQTLAERGGATVERSSGRFVFERPGRFRWEVRKPFEQLMVSDGRKLWFYDKDLNQVTVRPVAAAMGATPAAILFGSTGLEGDFVLSEAGQHDGLDWLEAIPRTRDAGFERIRIGFGADLPRAMEVVDAFGRTIRFSFDSIVSNPPLDASSFRFVVPAGADVIEQ